MGRHRAREAHRGARESRRSRAVSLVTRSAQWCVIIRLPDASACAPAPFLYARAAGISTTDNPISSRRRSSLPLQPRKPRTHPLPKSIGRERRPRIRCVPTRPSNPAHTRRVRNWTDAVAIAVRADGCAECRTVEEAASGAYVAGAPHQPPVPTLSPVDLQTPQSRPLYSAHPSVAERHVEPR